MDAPDGRVPVGSHQRGELLGEEILTPKVSWIGLCWFGVLCDGIGSYMDAIF